MGFLSLYSTTLSDVMGEDTMLLLSYWQRQVVQSIKCSGANNCGAQGLV